MKRVAAFALLVFALATRVSTAGTQFIPVMNGPIGGRLYRTTLELRANQADQCKFELRPLNGGRFEAVQQLEPAQPVVLQEFGGDFHVSSAVRMTCAGDVEVLSRIQESSDDGAKYSRGVLLSGPAREPIGRGETAVVPVHGALNIAEVAGSAVHVKVSCSSDHLRDLGAREYDLAPREQQLIEFGDDLGAIQATIDVAGDGKVAFSTQPIDLQESVSPQAIAALSAIRDIVAAPFKGAPFYDEATGLVYMRDRWYDPRTGTFLTPDPQGYGDSSNLYAYCGGDPVNCSDPTGEAASMGLSGWITATDNRNGGRIVHFSPEQIARDPVGIRRFLGLNADVDPREADALIARAGGIAELGNLRGIAVARRGTRMAEPVVNATGSGLALMSDFTGVGSAAQLTQAFIEKGPTKTNIAIAGLTLIGLGASDDLIRLGATEADNVGAIARSEQTTQQLLTAGRRVKHHLFNKFRGNSPGSQKYRDFFAKHGIDVDQYSVEIPEAMHQKLIHGSGNNWTTRWKQWIDAHPDATTPEVYQFAGQLMDEYGLSGLPIVPYR